tara:strand:- start:658 stop:2019 length:1362 start_codon:yes stop_codon:yes gene_type:complete
MHVHILGICGTFMGGIASIAKQMGHHVTGSDLNVYPPMSTQLETIGIELIEGFAAQQLDLNPDCIVVGNVMTRGHAVIETMLERQIPMLSGPQWLRQNVLSDRWVLAVSGTHGKTTTASMLAHILEYAGLQPGYLIGGVPNNFNQSARFGEPPFFVIEADEYDTAFFDKRAKFVHYQPRTLILNNLEFDHADIFRDLIDIQKQFHHAIKLVPASGKLIVNGEDENIAELLAMGCWSEQETFGSLPAHDWQLQTRVGQTEFDVRVGQQHNIHCQFQQLGRYNAMNAVAAMAAARHVGVSPDVAGEALAQFSGVKRRLENKGEYAGITVYDDFAHHPTEIHCTLESFSQHYPEHRLIVVFEPRSNSMQMGSHVGALKAALSSADKVFAYDTGQLDWSLNQVLTGLDCMIQNNINDLVLQLLAYLEPGDNVLILSNGGFEGLCLKLITALQAQTNQ